MIQESKQKEYESVATFYGNIDFSSETNSYYVTYHVVDTGEIEVVSLLKTKKNIIPTIKCFLMKH